MAQLNPKEMQQALAKPFAPEDLEWRLQNTIEEQMRGLAVPYVTNRAIQNRLDEVCGPENWYNDFKPWHSNGKRRRSFAASPSSLRAAASLPSGTAPRTRISRLSRAAYPTV